MKKLNGLLTFLFFISAYGQSLKVMSFNIRLSLELKIISAEMLNTYHHSAEKPYGPKGTFTSFDVNTIPTERTDYNFVKDFKIESFRTINDRRENLLYPSDHFPIRAELSF